MPSHYDITHTHITQVSHDTNFELLWAESPKNIFFVSSGSHGDSYPLGTGPLLFSVFYGMQSILCSARRRKRGTPYSRNTPRKGK
jgi:hypothetical protein